MQKGWAFSFALKLHNSLLYGIIYGEGGGTHGYASSKATWRIEEKDKSTYEHSFRVADLIHKYSAATNLGIELTQRLIFCAELHDIGKLILPNRILKKAGPLTDSEWKAVKEHPRLGSELIRQTFGCERLWESCIVMTHHERMDGHGYPSGLQGEEIPLEARIIAVADAVDVMLHGREYQRPMSSEECKREVLRCSGAQFDPEPVAVFTHEII